LPSLAGTLDMTYATYFSLLTSTNRCSALGKFTFIDYCVEFFLPLKCRQKGKSFAVGYDCSGQIVERWGVFGSCTSCYLGVR
jgi:hypothetical protein